MIVVTGGAGFIGSVLVHALNKRGIRDILVVDHLGTKDKWMNLRGLKYHDLLDKNVFIGQLENGRFGSGIEAIFHLGACSSTTQTDADYLFENNYRYTCRIVHWWEKHRETRFIYASSAATYGNGEHGYIDDEAQLNDLRPLNMYGYSKHLFDLYASSQGLLKNIVGLKYFNVFGPNEYHKEDMRSIICKAFSRIRDEGTMTLFKSHRPEYKDGDQVRDFIYVKDAVAMTLFFYDNPKVGGLFNIGTAVARSWNDLAKAIFCALDKQPHIEYIPTPENIRDKYQYHTQADLEKLRSAGCSHECISLENAIADYVQTYLLPQTYIAD